MISPHATLVDSPKATERVKVALLAGDLTHHAGEGEQLPKAMVKIGGRPILWHLLSRCSAQGLSDFVVGLGEKGDIGGRYLFDQAENGSDRRGGCAMPGWTVELLDTCAAMPMGGRIERLRPYFGGGAFLLAAADCFHDVDLQALLAYHRACGRLATLVIARPQARFGKLSLAGDRVVDFAEKPQEEGWVSGGLCVFESEALDYVQTDDNDWEIESLERLAMAGELVAFKHAPYWQRLETLHDKKLIEGLWQEGRAPWKAWEGEG